MLAVMLPTLAVQVAAVQVQLVLTHQATQELMAAMVLILIQHGQLQHQLAIAVIMQAAVVVDQLLTKPQVLAVQVAAAMVERQPMQQAQMDRQTLVAVVAVDATPQSVQTAAQAALELLS
jgi:hypothetical protein